MGVSAAMGIEHESARRAVPTAPPPRTASERPAPAPDGLAEILHHADAATIARTVSRLQRRHGNRAVRAAISRAPTGLADTKVVDRFVGVAKTLADEWDKLKTPEARAKLLTDAALAELKTLGVPAYAVSVKDLGSNAGSFDFQTWTMEMGKDPFAGPLPPKAALADLADTVLHESRHCEQWFRMARYQAGAGKSSADIATATKIPARITDEAFKQKLSAAGTELTEAEGWWKSVYGADRLARNKTLTDLETLDAAYETAKTKYEQVKAKASSTKEEKEQAKKDRDTAFAAYQAAFAKYQALPEEADAWKVGAAVTAGMMK
jgi:hypothetical protein